MARNDDDRQPGIVDVARAAGVSIATVSRVLNDSHQVSQRRRERVENAIRQLGYRPNEAARALVSGRQSMVGVLIGNTARYGFASVLKGIEEAARAENMLVTIIVVEADEPSHVATALELVRSQRLTGVIGVAFDPAVSRAMERLPAGLPVVAAALVGSERTDRPRAMIDDEAGARLATGHLLDLGHPVVHHLSTERSDPIERGRTNGYLRALRDRDVVPPPIARTGWELAEARLSTLYEIGPDVTALFGYNDEIAMAAIRALTEQGRRVPDDISVVGFDDEPLSSFWTPPLTSVNMPFTGLGREAFFLLQAVLDDADDPYEIELAPRLIIRESTAPPG